MHPQPPTTDELLGVPLPAAAPAVGEIDRELTIVLAEYGHQYNRQKAALDGVNQTLTLYLGALAFVGPLAGAVAVLGQNSKVNPFVVAGLMAFASAASFFALLRSYKARVEQTYAEKALSRLRNYFLDRHPGLRIYLPGPLHDDWQTPFSRRSRSVTFYGWTAFCIAAGAFAGFATMAFMSGLPYVYAPWFALLMPAAVVLVAFGAPFAWLWKQLNDERDAFVPRFPRHQNDEFTQRPS